MAVLIMAQHGTTLFVREGKTSQESRKLPVWQNLVKGSFCNSILGFELLKILTRIRPSEHGANFT